MTDLHNTEVPVTSDLSARPLPGWRIVYYIASAMCGLFIITPLVTGGLWLGYRKDTVLGKIHRLAFFLSVASLIVTFGMIFSIGLAASHALKATNTPVDAPQVVAPSQQVFSPTPQALPRTHSGGNRPPVVHGGADSYLPNFINKPTNMEDVRAGLFLTHELAFCNHDGKTDASYLSHYYAYADAYYKADLAKLSAGGLCDPANPKGPDPNYTMQTYSPVSVIEQTDSDFIQTYGLRVGPNDQGIYRLHLVKLDGEWLVESNTPVSG